MRKLLLGVAASALFATGAFAADPVDMVQPTYDSAAFDWDGFYAGLGVSGALWSNTLSVGMFEGIVGVNMTSGDVLFGIEGTLGAGYDSLGAPGYQLTAEGRLGYLVTPDVLVYGSLGAAYFSLPAAPFATLGAGIEFAVSDNVSFDLEYEYWAGAALTAHTIDASVLFHF